MSKSDIKSKKRTYKKPANSKIKPEVVEVLSTEPKKLVSKAKEQTKLLSEEQIEKETTRVFMEGMKCDNIGELMSIQIKMQLGQMMLQMKHERRKQERDDAKFEFIKSKVQSGAALTFEDTSDIDKEINMLLLGTTEKAEKENGSTENNSVETIK